MTWTILRNPKEFQPESPSNPNKDSDSEVLGEGAESVCNAHQATCDLSQERDAKDATVAKQVAEAVAREMAKVYAHYHALLNERGAVTMQTSLQNIRF